VESAFDDTGQQVPLVVGGVYTESNSLDTAIGNAVQMFARGPDGSLTSLGTIPTGGFGTGAGLGSQGSVRLSPDNQHLLAVSAGTDQLTAFQVNGNATLTRLNVVGSGGVFPISVTATDSVAYVLNAGGSQHINGYFLNSFGLTPLDGRQNLSPTAAGPAEVRFSPSASLLDVTEKFSNTIDIFPVGGRPVAGPPVQSPSAGVEPFGSAWSDVDRLLVTDTTSNAVTLYAVGPDNRLTVVAGPVPNFQSAPCWIAVTGNQQFAYVANTGSGTISSYAITRNSLQLLASVAAVIGGAPIDLDLSSDSRFLYALNGTTITALGVNADGSLTPIGVAPVIPGSVGLAAF